MTREATRARSAALDAVSPDEFRQAMSSLASGVVMVTSWVDGRPWGTTVTSFASVSAEPPTILVSLGSETTSARAIESAGGFGISMLGRGNLAAARHGSAGGAAKFLEPFVDRRHRGGRPAIAGALAHLDGEVIERFGVADHTIFVARVRDADLGGGAHPLVYFQRDYRTLAPRGNPRTRRRIPCLSS